MESKMDNHFADVIAYLPDNNRDTIKIKNRGSNVDGCNSNINSNSNNNNNNGNNNGNRSSLYASLLRHRQSALQSSPPIDDNCCDRSSIAMNGINIEKSTSYSSNNTCNTSNSNSYTSNSYTSNSNSNSKKRRPRRARGRASWDPLKRRKSSVFLPRMVDRDLPFHQSSNSMNIRNFDPTRQLWKLQMIDWFHVLLRVPAYLSVGVLLLSWVAMVLAFAGAYWYEDNLHYAVVDCGLGITEGSCLSMPGSFAFSLETWTTVGYGLPGTSTSFFEKGCTLIQGTIFLEMVCSMMFNAFLFAFFFSLLSKSEFRSTQIIFTNKLLVNVERNEKAYVRLQCYDIDSAHPLVEAHARMYFLDHKLRMHPLRLMDPNDELGGVLYPSVPADIVHHIDHHSALCPPAYKLPYVQSSHGITLRSLDSYVGNRDEIVCPVCGDSFGTYQRWKKHVGYNKMMEANCDGLAPEQSHAGLVLPPEPPPISLEDVRSHIETTLSEIIVVVEATDPQLSGTFQSLQSYKYEDIVFGEEFAKCMSTVCECDHRLTFCVDVEQFHDTVRKPCTGTGTGTNRQLSPLTVPRPGSLDQRDGSSGSVFRGEGDYISVPPGAPLSPPHDPITVSDAASVVRFSDRDDRDPFDRSTVLKSTSNTYFGRSYDTFNSMRMQVGWGEALKCQNSKVENEEETTTDDDDDDGDDGDDDDDDGDDGDDDDDDDDDYDDDNDHKNEEQEENNEGDTDESTNYFDQLKNASSHRSTLTRDLGASIV